MIPLTDAKLLDQLHLQPGKCERNAERWVRIFPDYQVIEGWALYTAGLFVPHYVVGPLEDDAELVDVTCRRAPTTEGIPFNLHMHVSAEPLSSFKRADPLG